METSATDTRTRLAEAGLRLFAKQGIDGVQTQEIVEAAGQRNASAIQYYFGSKGGLLRYVVVRHQSVIEVARSAMLTRLADEYPVIPLADLVDCVVVPAFERLGVQEGRYGTRLISQIIQKHGTLDVSFADAPSRKTYRRVMGLIEDHLQPLPVQRRRTRIAMAVSMTASVLSERAIQIDNKARHMTNDEDFLGELSGGVRGILRQE